MKYDTKQEKDSKTSAPNTLRNERITRTEPYNKLEIFNQNEIKMSLTSTTARKKR